MKINRRIKIVLTLAGCFTVAGLLAGCGAASDPASPPLTEQTAAEQIKKVQDDPKLPSEAKAQRMAQIKQALKTAQPQNAAK